MTAPVWKMIGGVPMLATSYSSPHDLNFRIERLPFDPAEPTVARWSIIYVIPDGDDGEQYIAWGDGGWDGDSEYAMDCTETELETQIPLAWASRDNARAQGIGGVR